MSAVLSTISGLLGKVVEPIAKLIGDERFTAQEKAELVNAELLAELANERAAFEIEKLEWAATSEKEKRLAAEAKAQADIQQALANVHAAQTQEDDLFTKRVRPTAAYLMSLMLLADQVWHMTGHERFFTLPMLTGYFSLLGIYIAGRSFEKFKRAEKGI
jgi:predicted  nucleic acid-binding Zn-ribbon protein